MDTSVFFALALACAPQVHADTARALVSVESAFNPWAIGVVGGALVRQPRHRAEALATARALRDAGWNFSVGLGQINVGNFDRLGLTVESAFEPCANLTAMQTVLTECFDRANGTVSNAVDQVALRQALSCYYSGNFDTGYVDNRWGERIGAAMLLSLIDDSVKLVIQNQASDRQADTIVLPSTTANTSKLAEKVLDSTINIPPLIYQNQGGIVGIYVARDVDFSSVYELKPTATAPAREGTR